MIKRDRYGLIEKNGRQVIHMFLQGFCGGVKVVLGWLEIECKDFLGELFLASDRYPFSLFCESLFE